MHCRPYTIPYTFTHFCTDGGALFDRDDAEDNDVSLTTGSRT